MTQEAHVAPFARSCRSCKLAVAVLLRFIYSQFVCLWTGLQTGCGIWLSATDRSWPVVACYRKGGMGPSIDVDCLGMLLFAGEHDTGGVAG